MYSLTSAGMFVAGEQNIVQPATSNFTFLAQLILSDRSTPYPRGTPLARNLVPEAPPFPSYHFARVLCMRYIRGSKRTRC